MHDSLLQEIQLYMSGLESATKSGEDKLFYSSLKDLARLKRRKIRTRLSIGQSSITSYLIFLLSFSGLNGPLQVFY